MNLTPVFPDINTFPEKIRIYMIGANLFDSSCHSDAVVIYSSKGYFIKRSPKGTLIREAMLGKVFYELGLGAEVSEYVQENEDYLVTKEAPGKDLTHFIGEPESVCEILIRAMKLLHNTENDMKEISEAVKIYRSAVPKEETSIPSPVAELFGIRSWEEAVDTVKNTPCPLKCDTLIHGDFCLPNLLYDDSGKITFIDFAYSGMGDKNIDIYWACWSLWFNTKDIKWAEYFLSLYGHENYSMETLRYIASVETIL